MRRCIDQYCTACKTSSLLQMNIVLRSTNGKTRLPSWPGTSLLYSQHTQLRLPASVVLLRNLRTMSHHASPGRSQRCNCGMGTGRQPKNAQARTVEMVWEQTLVGSSQ